jgi:hypothetical protein
MDIPDNDKQQAGVVAGSRAADEFSGLKLRRFISPCFGVVLNAPQNWQENSNEQLFQIIDPLTDTQFTASGFENPGMALLQWADALFSSSAKGMPFLKAIKAPYAVEGVDWSGLAAEFQGTFPDRDYQSHYLVLCLCSEKVLVSFTVTARVAAFAENEAFYRWLLQTQLALYQVEKIQDAPQGAAKMRELAEQGDDNAQFSLAVLYEIGQGVPQNDQMAATWLSKAAEQVKQGVRSS